MGFGAIGMKTFETHLEMIGAMLAGKTIVHIETKDKMKIASSVFFLEGRIKFLKPDFREGHNAGCGSILISYGYTPNYSKLKGWQAK
jgi:hypothetical protein